MPNKYLSLLLSFIILFSVSCKKQSLKPVVGVTNVGTTTPITTSETSTTYDIVVYGGTSAGVIAAAQAAKMGKSVLLVCNSARIGGMTAAGLSNTDIGNSAVVGGLTLSYYKKVQSIYGSTDYKLEPKVALQVFKQIITDNNIKVLYSERLLLKGGVAKTGTAITSITMESGKTIKGKMFIDASYEGDLMAKSGVSYFVGREGNSKYGESHNGLIGMSDMGIDPYIIEGKPASGLLNYVNPSQGTYGGGDQYTQGYNFRLCMTNVAANKVAVTKPADYDSTKYRMLFRILAKNPKASFWGYQSLPNNKVDVNNSGPFSTDYIGGNTAYPDADYDTRAKIIKDHESYQRGLIWTLQNDTRIPASVRSVYADFGLAKDEFTENNNWPTELYIREGRRMIGGVVLTENHLLGTISITDPIGLGSYAMDSHGVSYYFNAKTKSVWLEGEFYVDIKPYGISYRSIIPAKAECSNLLVPVCMSATHVAYGSIRMEPQYMIMGQAAATAAALAIDGNVGVQDLNYDLLKNRLVADGQKIKM